jgi:hypothetical protein
VAPLLLPGESWRERPLKPPEEGLSAQAAPAVETLVFRSGGPPEAHAACGKAAVWPLSFSPANLGRRDHLGPQRKAHRRRPPLRWRLSSSDLASSRPDLVDVWWRRAVVHRRATEAGQWQQDRHRQHWRLLRLTWVDVGGLLAIVGGVEEVAATFCSWEPSALPVPGRGVWERVEPEA